MTSDQRGERGEAAPPDRRDQPQPSFPTSLGTSEGTTITLLGQDLARGPKSCRRPATRNTFHPSRTDPMRREPRCAAAAPGLAVLP